MTRELRLVPVTMPLVPAAAAAPSTPSGGGIGEGEFWSVAAALLATGQISEDEYAAIIGATAVTALDR